MTPTLSDLAVGQDIGSRSIDVTRTDLVKYAGASGDFNPIHWNEAFATGVGLPGVIAHGMFTMALAGRALATWAGQPHAVVEFGVRFTRPVVVRVHAATCSNPSAGNWRGSLPRVRDRLSLMLRQNLRALQT